LAGILYDPVYRALLEIPRNSAEDGHIGFILGGSEECNVQLPLRGNLERVHKMKRRKWQGEASKDPRPEDFPDEVIQFNVYSSGKISAHSLIPRSSITLEDSSGSYRFLHLGDKGPLVKGKGVGFTIEDGTWIRFAPQEINLDIRTHNGSYNLFYVSYDLPNSRERIKGIRTEARKTLQVKL